MYKHSKNLKIAALCGGGEVSVNLNSFPRRFIFRRFARAEKGLHAGAPGKIGNRA